MLSTKLPKYDYWCHVLFDTQGKVLLLWEVGLYQTRNSLIMGPSGVLKSKGFLQTHYY